MSGIICRGGAVLEMFAAFILLKHQKTVLQLSLQRYVERGNWIGLSGEDVSNHTQEYRHTLSQWFLENKNI